MTVSSEDAFEEDLLVPVVLNLGIFRLAATAALEVLMGEESLELWMVDWEELSSSVGGSGERSALSVSLLLLLGLSLLLLLASSSLEEMVLLHSDATVRLDSGRAETEEEVNLKQRKIIPIISS